MIETLRIERLAVIDRAELEFGPGLNVLTGETGAGKSIVRASLALLAGARASAESIREGAEDAVVEAVFRTDRLPDLEARLGEHGLEPDGHELVVRRALSRSGRSRASVAGQLVPISLLADLFAGRVEISSQHESQALLRPEVHGRLLDAAGGLAGEREAVAAAYAALRDCRAEHARLSEAAAERARREDFLAFQVREIDEAKLVPGEQEELAAERRRLRHAERLGAEAAGAAACLTGDPIVADAPAATDLVGRAEGLLEVLAELDPRLGTLAERLAAAGSELRDVAGDLERYASSIEADPARLSEVEERLAALERLERKYGADLEEVLAFRDRSAAELAALAGSDERLAALGREAETLTARLAERATSLSRGRARAARRLERDLEAALRELEMPEARFAIGLEPAAAPAGMPCGPAGAEAPEFRFSANPGEPPRELRRVASGGELSRVFLALKNVLRRAEGSMVLVFDEVDAGVGGRVADRVGRVLGELAAEHQVICISHLPQIAALAHAHFRVTKAAAGGRTATRVERLAEAERVEEIARMAGGAKVSEATRRHARELLRGAD